MPHSTPPTENEDTTLPDAPVGVEENIKESTVAKDEPPTSPPLPDVTSTKEDDSQDLKNIFNEEDGVDDDDFLKNAGELMAQAARAPTGHSDPAVMVAFYQRIFPWKSLFHWLNQAAKPNENWTRREFAFTLPNDVYLRYQSFTTYEDLRKDVLRLKPSRFEIGPVYTANPRDRKALRKAAFRPIEKELVFDIDLTDYDEIRTCCDKANICLKCWNFITVAIKVLDVALKEDLGFKHVLWVYSGRRGAHAWVCDQRARIMDDSKRKAVTSYLELVKGGSQAGKKVNVRRPLHPHIQRSLDVLRQSFEDDILRDQDPWREDNKSDRLLQLLPDETLNKALRKKWQSHSGRPSTSKWADIDAVAETGVSKSLNTTQLKEHKQDIILEYMYPRLDANVSLHLNHLLKSPFVVHPGTGRVCVPIDSSRPEDFNPLEVPTVSELLKEIDDWNSKDNKGNQADKRLADYEKTSLKPYVDYFRRYVSNLMKESGGGKRDRDGDSEMEF